MDDGEELQDDWSRWSGRIWSSNVINTRERGRGEKARMAERNREVQRDLDRTIACLPRHIRCGSHRPTSALNIHILFHRWAL